MPDLGEFGSIARYLAPLAGAPGLGLLDDAALFTPPLGRDLVVTKDAMVAGVHFLPDDPPALVARKLMRVNLSDLAAMGAEPVGYLVAFALPQGEAEAWMAGLAQGLAADQEAFGWRLWGGDTVVTPGPVTLSLTALGAVPPGQALRRGGARPGDGIFVSGTIGDAALGLAVRRGELAGLAPDHARTLEDRLMLPRPRLALGRRLTGLASAAMDVSDGLAADLAHICEVSQVAARLDLETVPLSPAARAALVLAPRMRPNLFEGEDYELLFTAPPAAQAQLAAITDDLNLSLTKIGDIEEGTGVRLLQGGDVPRGYRHF